MFVIGACALCLRHIRCLLFVFAPPLGIRTAPERQEALQALISFICRCAACLLPSKQTCGDTVQRQTTHNIYGHLVIWSFGQSAKKKVCQNLYSIIYIYILYYSPNDTLSFFENDQMTKWPNDHIFTTHDLMTVNPSPVLSLSWRGRGSGIVLCKSLCSRLLQGRKACASLSHTRSLLLLYHIGMFFTALFTALVSEEKCPFLIIFLLPLCAFCKKMLTLLLYKAIEK